MQTASEYRQNKQVIRSARTMETKTVEWQKLCWQHENAEAHQEQQIS